MIRPPPRSTRTDTLVPSTPLCRSPGKLGVVLALMGDSVDNVPGGPGIGPKRASDLINQFGDVEAVLAAAPGLKPSKMRDNLIEHAEMARLSRRLVELARAEIGRASWRERGWQYE